MLKCNKCYHDTLFIGSREDGKCCIKCSNCNTEIELSETVTSTEELILYNINMSEAYAEGKIAFMDGKQLKDNPYGSGSLTQDSSNWWVRGWTEEKQQMSSVSTFLSAKKEMDGELGQITEDLKTLTTQYENLERFSDKNQKNYSNVFDLCELIVKLLTELKTQNYWFGGPYRVEIKKIMQAISDFCKGRDFTL